MADEARLPPDQIAEVAQAVVLLLRPDIVKMLEASARHPPATPTIHPPVKFEGLDPQQRDQLKRELLIEAKDYVRGEIGDFLPVDEIDARDRRSIESLKTDLLKDLRNVVRDEINGLRKEFFEIFEDLGMPLERGDDKRKKTAERLSDLFKMRDASKEWKGDFGRAIRNTSIAGALAAVSGFLGYLFSRGGSPH